MSPSQGERPEHRTAQVAIDDEVIRIFIATDIHIGFKEDDPVRKNDAIMTYEEVLRRAVDENADMVLLGGDLFHDHKPSTKSFQNVMSVMQSWCLGDSDIFLATPLGFDVRAVTCSKDLNWMAGDHNIMMPVFSIHGNHDDPGIDYDSMEVLSRAGLINYFGKQEKTGKVVMRPILLEKNGVHIALYGLGSMPDERLYGMFVKGDVEWVAPPEKDKYFKILVFHQNRENKGGGGVHPDDPDFHKQTKRNEKWASYIPTQFLWDDIDFVLWGHEHESFTSTVEEGPGPSFFDVWQPGSTVATSLIAAESKPKHAGMLKIFKRARHVDKPIYELSPRRLATVRPFVYKELYINDVVGLNLESNKAIEDYLKDVVNEMIDSVEREEGDMQTQEGIEIPFHLPLILLKVEYSRPFQPIQVQRFGGRYHSEVANPRDMLRFTMRRQLTKVRRKPNGQADVDDVDKDLEAGPLRVRSIEELLADELVVNSKTKALNPIMVSNAIRKYVEKDSRDTINRLIEFTTLKMRQICTEDFLSRTEERGLSMEEEIKTTVTSAAQELVKGSAESGHNQARQEDDRENISPPPAKKQNIQRKRPLPQSIDAHIIPNSDDEVAPENPDVTSDVDEEQVPPPAARPTRSLRERNSDDDVDPAVPPLKKRATTRKQPSRRRHRENDGEDDYGQNMEVVDLSQPLTVNKSRRTTVTTTTTSTRRTRRTQKQTPKEVSLKPVVGNKGRRIDF
eukprot:Clim_evm24s128 gene=Clim_evmTU24s128